MTENEITTTPEEASQRSGPQWGRILAWAGLLLLLTIVALGLIRTQEGPVSVGKEPPAFELTTYEGDTITSADLEGKIVVLNFWASWCIPCEQEADELETAWQIYKERDDVIFLGVAWSDMDTKAKEYLDEFGVTYPNGPDLGTRISQSFRIRGVPETYIIDQQGILAHAKIGPFTSVAQIQSVVDSLLIP